MRNEIRVQMPIFEQLIIIENQLSAMRKILFVLFAGMTLISCQKDNGSNNNLALIKTLNCAGAINNGTLTAGTAASGVNSVVPYTGGNEGMYPAQTITSTGVTGLTVSLAAGTLVNGTGSLTYTITGTPSSSGIVSFTLNIGGQTCILSRTVLNENTGTPHTCGATNVHNPNKSYGTVKDIDGNTYKTIQVGTQTWMAENLKVTKYRNGVSIPNITDNTQWVNNTTGAFCSYNNNTSNDCPYGKLYNWYAVANSNQLCPTGWHVPTDEEWTTLTNFLGGESVAGGKMKSTGTQYSIGSDANATNSSGFSGLLAGGRNYTDGAYEEVGVIGGWWSSTEPSIGLAWNRLLLYFIGEVSRNDTNMGNGNSVRCIKD